jgi:hypothetical protein
MRGLQDILNVMVAFRDNRLTPAQFVTDYMAHWKALRDEQDRAIARHPTVGPALRSLSEKFQSNVITPEHYWEGVQEQYARLDDVRLRPGSNAAEILDHVFLEADAYREEPDAPGEPYISGDDLHETVRQALHDLNIQSDELA